VEQSTDTMTTALAGDRRSVESVLKALWERVQGAGKLIQQLREERQALLSQVDQLRAEVQHLQQDLSRKEQLIKTMTVSQGQAGVAFANGEREALVRRVKDLLAKIDAYL
jgi:peptidoglycan hydrolase CwlO-like protein